MINKGKGWRLATVAAALMMAGSAWATEYSASFKNADIEEFINTVGKNLNKTIIIEPSVRGKINVRSYDLLNEDQYYQFFLSVLDVYGFAVVPMNNGVLKVVRSKDAKTSAIPVVDDSNPGVGDEMVTRVVPVRNVSVRELAPLLRQLNDNAGGGNVVHYEPSNVLLITGRADSEPGSGPLRVGVAVIDLFTGMYATSAILSALEARHHTGRGQHIDMALLDVAMAVLANQGTGFLNTGSIPGRQGNTHPSVVPYQDFPTADGNMLLAIGNDGQFARFCEAAGVAWHQDARFTTNAGRVIHRVEMVDMMSGLTVSRSTADWIALLEARAVPCGPINNIHQAFEDPQVQARGLRITQQRYPDGQLPQGECINQVVTTASPLRLSDTPATLRYAPPALGQHTDEVLRERLQLDAAQLQALRDKQVL